MGKTLEELAVEVDSLRRAISVAASGPCDMRLDGDYSDAEIRVEPKDAPGGPMKGKRMSECSPEALLSLAGLYEWMADKDEKENKQYNGKPSAPGTRKRAALARGWALAKILGTAPGMRASTTAAPRAPAAPPAFKPPPPPAPPPYGTTGHGGSAKHTTTPGPQFYDDVPADDDIPF